MKKKYLQLNDIDAYKTAYQIHKPEIESIAIEQYKNVLSNLAKLLF